jgi:hypothetical protein
VVCIITEEACPSFLTTEIRRIPVKSRAPGFATRVSSRAATVDSAEGARLVVTRNLHAYT